MHPRMLATDSSCSGGTCPAVYDDDPGLKPGELAIVGKKPRAGLTARLRDRIAPDEALVTISRGIVLDALSPAAEPVDLAMLMTHLETFSHTAFRLETQQVYASTGRDEQWVTLLRAGRRWGKTYRRIHVIAEPLSPAMQQELTEGYGPNADAGEVIGIIPVSAAGEWPGGIPERDFWLFDSSELLVMRYEPDGTWTGAEWIADPYQIVQACRARDAAMHRAVPWRDYIATRPELQRRLAQ